MKKNIIALIMIVSFFSIQGAFAASATCAGPGTCKAAGPDTCDGPGTCKASEAASEPVSVTDEQKAPTGPDASAAPESSPD